MKWLPVYFLALQSCLVHAGQYAASRTSTGCVYDEAGGKIDACTMKGQIVLTMTDDSRISADPRTMRLHVDNGSKMLRLEPEILAVFSEGALDVGRIPPTHLDLTDGKMIKWSIRDQGDSSANWTEMERHLLEEYRSKKLDLAAILPGTWLLSKIPFVLHVDEGLKVGDDVDVCLRKPFDPNHISSADRAGKLTCISNDDELAVLTSNRTIETRSMYITWHVQVDYDVRRQQMLRVIEEHFSRLRPTPGKETHTVLDVVQCQLRE